MNVYVYVNDILICSSSFEQNLYSRRWVFEKISAVGLTLKYKKC